MIALYVNEQISAITRQRLPERIKQMTQIYALFKKCTLFFYFLIFLNIFIEV